MKKLIFNTVLLFCSLTILPGICNAQGSGRTAGTICSCGAGQSSCNSSCLFSDCCICWNPSTQNGACGCYWGVATCKSDKIDASRSFSIDPNRFADVNPDAHIKFSFENFRKVFNFFKEKGLNTATLESIVSEVSGHYGSPKGKVDISNDDAGNILKSYSDLIFKLDVQQRDQLNIFIKSL